METTVELDGVKAVVLLVLAMVALEDGWCWKLGLEGVVAELTVLGEFGIEERSQKLVVVEFEGLVVKKDVLEGFVCWLFCSLDGVDFEETVVFGAATVEGRLFLVLLLQEDCGHVMLAIDSEVSCGWGWRLLIL